MLLVLAGMIWGLQMAITDDHSAFPAHAHLNLLGFVALFLFGIFYRLNPAVEANRLAIPHVFIWIVGTVVMAIGVGLVHTGHPAGPATRSPRSARSPYSQTQHCSLGSFSRCGPPEDHASRVAVRLD